MPLSSSTDTGPTLALCPEPHTTILQPSSLTLALSGLAGQPHTLNSRGPTRGNYFAIYEHASLVSACPYPLAISSPALSQVSWSPAHKPSRA